MLSMNYSETEITDPRIKIILQHKSVLKDIQNHLRNTFLGKHTLPVLCEQFGTNEYILKSGFRILFNTTVFTYLLQLRLAHARIQLIDTDKTISEIADEIGYKNANHFSTAFKRKFGITPMEYRIVETENQSLDLSHQTIRHIERKRTEETITWRATSLKNSERLKLSA